MRDDIKQYAENLGIPIVYHFTRATNLPSILLNGIYPVSRVAEVNPNAAINDAQRFDGRKDGISVSIGHPNARMFYRYRKENPEIDWAVLAIDKSILWQKYCAFCKYNAADARISTRPLHELTTIDAFTQMYADDVDTPRADQKLKLFDPTDVQAEVLVFDVIEPAYIRGAAFQSQKVLDKYKSFFGERKIIVQGTDKGLFAARGYVRMYG